MDEKACNNLEAKQTKLEDAISKLTDISADLNKMIAVHELRLSQQEKITDSLEIILEKRRDEFDEREEKIYEHIEKEDAKIIEKLDESFDKFSKKMNDLERMMWVYGGGFALAAFVLANWGDVAKLLLKN
jgi:predicted RNase H-like nuclease (RuvC/YqgF family)